MQSEIEFTLNANFINSQQFTEFPPLALKIYILMRGNICRDPANKYYRAKWLASFLDQDDRLFNRLHDVADDQIAAAVTWLSEHGHIRRLSPGVYGLGIHVMPLTYNILSDDADEEEIFFLDYAPCKPCESTDVPTPPTREEIIKL